MVKVNITFYRRFLLLLLVLSACDDSQEGKKVSVPWINHVVIAPDNKHLVFDVIFSELSLGNWFVRYSKERS